MILAIDLGSTAFKAALFDRRRREVRFGSRDVVYRHAAGGRVEIAVAAIEAALKGAIADAIGDDRAAVEAVAITSQAQTFSLLDEAGRPQMPFISWRDGRSASVAAAGRLCRLLPDFGEHSGFNEVRSALQIAQLAALRPGVGCFPALLPVYVLRLLTGAFCVDSNQAAMTGLYSLQTGGWWPRALKACGLRLTQLPAIIPVGQSGGETGRGARRFGLPAGLPVVLAGNDQTAGAYGAGIERGGEVLLTLGTALAVYAYSESLPPPAPQRIRGPYPGGGGYCMTADSGGGAMITWAQTLLAGCATDDAFFAAAAKAPPGANGLVFVPSKENGGGDWHGGAPQHKPADYARALLESLTGRVAACVAELDRSSPQGIRAAGGGSCRRLWLKLIARRLGVRVTRTEGTPLRGAHRMATTVAC